MGGYIRVVGPEFARTREIDEIDDDYVHDALDKLHTDAGSAITNGEARTMALATARMASAEDLTRHMERYPHMRLLLDMDFFSPTASPDMITSSPEVAQIIVNSTPVREAFEVFRAGGSKRVENEWRAILTVWNVVFEQLSHNPRLGRRVA